MREKYGPEVDVKKIVNSTWRFVDGTCEKQKKEIARNMIEGLIAQGLSSAQIFQRIAQGNGAPSTHCSGFDDCGDQVNFSPSRFRGGDHNHGHHPGEKVRHNW